MRRLGPNTARLPGTVRVMCQGKQDGDFPVQVGRLVRDIRDVSPDIVHSRNWAAIEAVIAGRWVRSCTVVHSEHGLETDAGVRQPRRRTWFRRLAFELAHRVLSVSHDLKKLHARTTGFAADRIHVVHNGVDGRRFFPAPSTRARVRGELGLSEDEFCIGCVGNLLPVKDHLTVLRAVESIAGHLGGWRLIIVGEGSERPTLEAFIANHPEFEGRVLLTGTSDRVPELLQAMDVYVLPSLSEGISNSLLEAMSSGLPVIATDTGGNPEVVVDGESGLLFPVGGSARLAEQLMELHRRRDVRARLAQQAIRRVREEFSIDSMIRKYAQVYESLGRRTEAAPVRVAARL